MGLQTCPKSQSRVGASAVSVCIASADALGQWSQTRVCETSG
jgi:hypothetical protein